MADQDCLCQPCTRGGSQIKATSFCENCDEYLCENCKKIHRTIKSLLSHVIHDKVQVENDDRRAYTGSNPCSDHPQNQKDYFCTQCKSMCCRYCILDNHKECVEGPVYLPGALKIEQIADDVDISKKGPSFEELECMEKGLASLKKAMNTIASRMEANISDTKRKQHSADDAIQNVRTGMRNFVTALIECVAKNADGKINKARLQCISVHKKANDILLNLDDLRSSLNSSSASVDEALTNAMQTMDRSLTDLENEPKRLGGSFGQYCNSIQQVESFIEAAYRFGYDINLDDVEEAQLSWLCDFSLHVDTDEDACHVTGAIVTAPLLFVVDRGNKKLKVFDRREEQSVETPTRLLMEMPLNAFC